MLTVELDAASPRLVVSGSGRIALTPEADAELTFRVTDTSLDPYVRAFQPDLSPFTTAVVSGTVRIAGELRDPAHVLVDARVDSLTLHLFDYVVHNDGPIRVALDQQNVRLSQFRLVGEDTRLDVGGTVDLANQQMASTRPAMRTSASCRVSCATSAAKDRPISSPITGPLDKPVCSGEANVAGGRLRHFSLPHALEAINGEVSFDATGLRSTGSRRGLAAASCALAAASG